MLHGLKLVIDRRGECFGKRNARIKQPKVRESSVMKLNPQQAPLYGDCLLTVQLGDEERLEDEQDVEFYLLFAGTSQRHLTSTLRISHVTLQAVCPAHDCCESVQVTLCSARPGGSVDPLAEERFQFVQDLALDMAQFLVSTAGRADGLEGALLLDECQIPLQECERLDESLSLALRHLNLPQGWSVLGTDVGTPPDNKKLDSGTAEPGPHETLLHFAARRGLRKVALFLLQQPGAREALRLPNKQGFTPVSVAEKKGYDQLQQLFTEVETSPETRIQAEERHCNPGGRALQYHPRLNTYTLTVDTTPGEPLPSLQGEVEELQKLIQRHIEHKRDDVFQQKSADELITTTRSSDTLAQTASHHAHFTRGAWPFPNGQPEEGEAGPAQAGVKDCREVSERRSQATAQRPREGETKVLGATSCGKQPEETDRERTGVITARQGKPGRRRRNKEKRRVETDTADKVTAAPTAARPAMGQTQSQEYPEHPEAGREPQRDGERTIGSRDTREEMEGQGEDEYPLEAQLSAWARVENRQSSQNGGDTAECTESVAECRLQTMTGGESCHEAQAVQSQDSEQRQETTAAATSYSEEIQWAYNSSQTPEAEIERGGDGGGTDDTKTETGNLSQPTNGSTDSDRSRSGETETTSVKQSLSMAEVDRDSGLVHRTDEAVQTSGQVLDQPAETTVEIMVAPSQPSEQVLDQPAETKVDIVIAPSQPNVQVLDQPTEAVGDLLLTTSQRNVRFLDQPTDAMLDLPIAPSKPSVQVLEEPMEATRMVVVTPLQRQNQVGSQSQNTKECQDPPLVDSASRAVKKGDCGATFYTCSGEEDKLFQAEKMSEDGTFEGQKHPGNKEPSVQWSSLEEDNSQALREEIAATAAAVVAIALAAALANLEQCNSAQEANQALEATGSQKAHLTEDNVLTSRLAASEVTKSLATSDGHPSFSHGELVGGVVLKERSELEKRLRLQEENSGPPGSMAERGYESEARLAGPVQGDSHSDLLFHDGRTDEILTPSGTTQQEIAPQTPATHVPSHSETTLSTLTNSYEGRSPELSSPSELDRGKCLGDEQGSASVDVDSDVSLASITLDKLDGAIGRTMDMKGDSLNDLLPLDKSMQVEDMVNPVQRQEKEMNEPLSVMAESTLIHTEKDTFYPVQPCSDGKLQDNSTIPECTELPEAPCSDSVGGSVSVSDVDSLLSGELGEDSVFRKREDTVPGSRDSTSGVSVSFSSIEDVVSVGPFSTSSQGSVGPFSTSSQASVGPLSISSRGSEVPLWAGSPGSRASWSAGDPWQTTGPGAEEEEKKDQLADVPICPTILRSSIRSLSPFRRHSWGPGKNPSGEGDMNQRSSLPSHTEGKPPKPTLHRRSMSWCPSNAPPPHLEQIDSRSYSLERLSGEEDAEKASGGVGSPARVTRLDNEERGSLLSLTEEQESELGDCSSLDIQKSVRVLPLRIPNQLLTKSVSMLAISNRDLDGMGSFSMPSGSVEDSISEEALGPLRSDTEGRQGTKVSRTFSYLKSKMSTKKSKEKDKEKGLGKDKDLREKEKKTLNGHLYSSVSLAPTTTCHQCNKPINTKEAFLCTNCNSQVHKGCRESLPVCVKVRMKQQKQQTVTDSASLSGVMLRSTPTAASRERPWSTISTHDDQTMENAVVSRRSTSIRSFNSSNLSKSISISNIAGPLMDEIPLKGLRYLSQSTDSLHKTSKVNESTESLTDEGTEMMDSQLMGEFEAESKDLEAESWTFTVDKKYVKGLKKEVVKRQDVIYELLQTEMHHVRTLKIMSEVYSKGLQMEVQLETQTLDKVFPMLDELVEVHTHFFTHLLERKRESSIEGRDDGSFLIRKIGDVLVSEFSGPNAERMKKVYGKFCSRHNEAVNFYKELHTKDKRFQAFIKKKMSSTIVRRLGIPECILLVTQRITKYPVLLQRILQHTKDSEEDHEDISMALRLVKEILNAVDSKVNEQEKKKRLKEVYSRTDSKSIQRMKSGQMFAREDLLRGRRLLHDGALQLKNSAGRLKDVQAMLMSDVFVFLQEKDQKYVFASLDQRSTVISLQKLIVREVANEERGLFLITAGIEKPEMVEVLASTKEERNTWMQLIQDAMHSIEKDDDEGIPSETEEDKKLLESKARELRELLRKKDEQIISLLEEKVKVFRDMCDGSAGPDEEHGSAQSIRTRMMFRATPDDFTKGEPILKDALMEVETLHVLVNGSLGSPVGHQVSHDASGGSVGPVCLPRRAETFGGFDSHQMNISKNGEKEDSDDSLDLRRTESDSGLKKGGSNNLLLVLKRNSEHVLHSVTHLHDLLNTLQAVVIQQDTFMEEQRHALSDRPASRHSSSSSLSSLSSSRPNSLIEQEKQRSLEKQRQEAANLQRQQVAHAEERRRREREWDARESGLSERENAVSEQEEETAKRRRELEEERLELLRRKEEYQRDLERLRDAQRKLDRDRETLRREAELVEQMKKAEAEQERRTQRTPSTTSEESLKFQSSISLDKDLGGADADLLSSSPATKETFLRMGSKRKGKNLNPFSSSSSKSQSSTEGHNQIPNRLMQLAKSKKKKKSKVTSQPEIQSPGVAEPQADGEIYFC
ncbi:hypothetical protein UPYG_G00261800 [Umbra pygmaea]|uniref:A-kinase anchor protein 13 n=1 Tax=Umbra pygmaea TaxID=75934 RepID=A0ABD0WTD2_UMBPY